MKLCASLAPFQFPAPGGDPLALPISSLRCQPESPMSCSRGGGGSRRLLRHRRVQLEVGGECRNSVGRSAFMLGAAYIFTVTADRSLEASSEVLHSRVSAAHCARW